MAGLRPSQSRTVATGLGVKLHFGLLGNLQRIVDLDTEVPYSAF
jgi:hypothetical protein